MAKKGNRIQIGLICADCKNRNYNSTKNVINSKDKISFKKFCNHCRKITEHTENSKLK